MGTGRGKSRRAQALASKSPGTQRLSFERQKWDDFVQNSGMGEVKAYRYYRWPPKKSVVFYDAEEMITELFMDAVDVGAIFIPDGYSAEDFVFKKAFSLLSGNKMEINLKGKPKNDDFDSGFYLTISKEMKLGDENVCL